MDDFTTRTYGTSGLDNRPLFGETSARDRIINLVVGVLTTLLVLITVISSFVVPLPPKPINIFFAVCVVLLCGSVLVLIFWYRQGDLEPKFRKLIYYTLSSIALLCICANLYFHDVGRGQPSSAL